MTKEEFGKQVLTTLLTKSKEGNCYDVEPRRYTFATEKQFKYIKGFLHRIDLIGQFYDSYVAIINGWKVKASDCRWTPQWEITFYKLSKKEADEAWEREINRDDTEFLATLNGK